MEHVISDLRSTAHRCRDFAESLDPEELRRLSLRKATEVLGIVVEEALAIHKYILTVHVQQLDAILQRHPDEVASSKFDEVVALLHLPSSDDSEDDDDDGYNFLANLASFGMGAFPRVAERLEFIAARLGTLSTPTMIHNTTINNSNVGAIAAGGRATANGSVSAPRASRRRRG